MKHRLARAGCLTSLLVEALVPQICSHSLKVAGMKPIGFMDYSLDPENVPGCVFGLQPIAYTLRMSKCKQTQNCQIPSMSLCDV